MGNSICKGTEVRITARLLACEVSERVIRKYDGQGESDPEGLLCSAE